MALHVQGACENDVINIGSDVEMSILELAQAVIRSVGSASVIEHLPPLAEGDMTRRCPDTSKMNRLLKRPLVPVEEGIRRLADYYRAQQAEASAGRRRAMRPLEQVPLQK
jgi:nucleoside-diphosphate-sugar epimerase